MDFVTLSNGVKMPVLGFGVFQIDAKETEQRVLAAIRAGYRLIDTAQSYFNEEGVGAAVKKSGVAREELFITSKVWIEHYGYDACRASVLKSLAKMQLDLCCCINLLTTTTVRGGRWKIYMTKVK